MKLILFVLVLILISQSVICEAGKSYESYIPLNGRYVLESDHSIILFESVRSDINYNLEKYLNYYEGKSSKVINRSHNVSIGFKCDDADNRVFYPITETHLGIRVCMSFKLNENEKATNVLLMKLNCKPRPKVVAYFELNPKKGVTQISVSINEECASSPTTMLLFVKTNNNNIYGDSYLFTSARVTNN